MRRRVGLSRRGLLRGALVAALPTALVAARTDGVGAAWTADVATDALNLRSAPATDAEVLAVMRQGEGMTVLEGPADGWYRVRYGSQEGWASGEFLAVTGQADGAAADTAGGTGTATVNTDGLNLRSGPGTGYRVLLVLPQGARVAVVSGPSDGWYQVTYQGTTGWASGTYLKFGSTTTARRTATIDTDSLNLRSGPGTGRRVLAQMLHGETVRILGSSGEWYRVLHHGTRGYAFGAYLRLGGDSASFAVPVHQQEHSLSCEYASLQIATSALGEEIAEDRFIPVVGLADNPHQGFRGDIDAAYIFGTDDYGVYPEALAAALPAFGFAGRDFYGDTYRLKRYLRRGTPVVVWIDLGFDTSFTMDIGGEAVTMAPRSHVVVAYGFSDEGVLISDPDSSTPKRLIGWRDFGVMWRSMDRMALAVTR